MEWLFGNKDQIHQELWVAAIKGSVDNVKKSVINGANVNWKVPKEMIGKEMLGFRLDIWEEGWTPLHAASRFGHSEVIKFLIPLGATVNSKFGWTPLHLAAYNGKEEVVSILLHKGADPNIRTNDKYNEEQFRNKTASEIASIRRQSTIESLINDYVTKQNSTNPKTLPLKKINEGYDEEKKNRDEERMSLLNKIETLELEKEKIKKENDKLKEEKLVLDNQIKELTLKFEQEKTLQQIELNSLRKLVLEIKMEEIQKGEKIGSGGFAIVYRGNWKEKIVALKQMILPIDAKTLLGFDREASLIKSLQHPNIIQLYGVVKPSNENPIMVMEFFENGSLYQFLHERKETLKFEEQLSIVLDVANGINYLHQLNPKIIHRDLKSANVLLTKEKKAVLTDFGLAKVKIETQKVTQAVGTPQYMAPEMFDDEEGKLTEKVDIYSYGMVLFEISTNLIPFEGKTPQGIILSVHQGKRPIIPDHCNPFFKPLIEQCWIQDYSKRPFIIEICAKLELKKEI